MAKPRRSSGRTGILGAGPSGLCLGRFLRGEHEIVERSGQVGGHASSFFRDGYTFDHGPHILFSKNLPVLDFLVGVLGSNVARCRRKNQISYRGKFIRYPFENDLGSLDREDNFRCIWAYFNNPYRARYRRPKNLEQWLLAAFGAGICEAYLFPYNRKVWNLPVRRLSMLWADRIPRPLPETILQAALGFPTEGHLHQLFYHYPKQGGYQAISEALAREAGPLRRNYAVTAVSRLRDGRWEITDGKTPLAYDRLVSTLPIQDLVRLARFPIPERVREAVRRLIVNPMVLVSLGLRGPDPERRTAVYFPDPDFLVNRISYPATFAAGNAPAGHHSIQAEITCRAGDATWRKSDAEILEHTVAGLEERGLLRRRAITLADVRRSRHAYVVYDTGYERNVRIIRDWFPRQGIHLVGRFSYFEYINVDGAVERAREIAGRLNGAPVRL
jgi:protoporphyrinogen oxidase